MNTSKHIKKWRKKTKDRIVASMGGKCCICGYNKCNAALELHHIDPNEKDFGLGNFMSHIVSWNKIVSEIRKCILCCSNCHREIHFGVTKIPDHTPKFDEKFLDYKSFEKKFNIDKCPICGNNKNIKRKTCSVECYKKTIRKIDWAKVNVLEEIKSKTIAQIALENDISWNAVKKRLLKVQKEK